MENIMKVWRFNYTLSKTKEINLKRAQFTLKEYLNKIGFSFINDLKGVASGTGTLVCVSLYSEEEKLIKKFFLVSKESTEDCLINLRKILFRLCNP